MEAISPRVKRARSPSSKRSFRSRATSPRAMAASTLRGRKRSCLSPGTRTNKPLQSAACNSRRKAKMCMGTVLLGLEAPPDARMDARGRGATDRVARSAVRAPGAVGRLLRLGEWPVVARERQRHLRALGLVLREPRDGGPQPLGHALVLTERVARLVRLLHRVVVLRVGLVVRGARLVVRLLRLVHRALGVV